MGLTIAYPAICTIYHRNSYIYGKNTGYCIIACSFSYLYTR
jgi:hypothetical protein